LGVAGYKSRDKLGQAAGGLLGSGLVTGAVSMGKGFLTRAKDILHLNHGSVTYKIRRIQ
jgi:hypothetical protein